MRKKIFLLILSLLMCIGLSACDTHSEKTEEKDKQIVCTSFAAYDWTKELIKGADENLQVVYLLDNGVDLHNFQPTTEDFVRINTCDAFIYSGGVSDTWVEDALEQNENEDRRVMNFMDLDGIHLEEATDHECEEEEHHHEHHHELDEHVWLSVENAEICVQSICNMLVEILPENSEVYLANCEKYLQQLENLDAAFSETVAQSEKHTVLVADRFPFIYLMEEYGLDHHAAFPGCSAETEASFGTLVSLIDVLKEEKLTAVFVMEHADTDVADTIIHESGMDYVRILTLNSMQSVSKEEIEQGATYLSLMKENLKAIEQGLR